MVADWSWSKLPGPRVKSSKMCNGAKYAYWILWWNECTCMSGQSAESENNRDIPCDRSMIYIYIFKTIYKPSLRKNLSSLSSKKWLAKKWLDQDSNRDFAQFEELLRENDNVWSRHGLITLIIILGTVSLPSLSKSYQALHRKNNSQTMPRLRLEPWFFELWRPAAPKQKCFIKISLGNFDHHTQKCLPTKFQKKLPSPPPRGTTNNPNFEPIYKPSRLHLQQRLFHWMLLLSPLGEFRWSVTVKNIKYWPSSWI